MQAVILFYFFSLKRQVQSTTKGGKSKSGYVTVHMHLYLKIVHRWHIQWFSFTSSSSSSSSSSAVALIYSVKVYLPYLFCHMFGLDKHAEQYTLLKHQAQAVRTLMVVYAVSRYQCRSLVWNLSTYHVDNCEQCTCTGCLKRLSLLEVCILSYLHLLRTSAYGTVSYVLFCALRIKATALDLSGHVDFDVRLDLICNCLGSVMCEHNLCLFNKLWECIVLVQCTHQRKHMQIFRQPLWMCPGQESHFSLLGLLNSSSTTLCH